MCGATAYVDCTRSVRFARGKRSASALPGALQKGPGALFIIYSNPMAMNTWACNTYGGIRTLGLCHGVQGARRQIAECIQLWARKNNLICPHETVDRRDVDVIAVGINHQTWFIQVCWRSEDMPPHMLEMFEAHPSFVQTEKVRIDVLRCFGYYSTKSNGHLSEYLPWYRKRLHEVPQRIDLTS